MNNTKDTTVIILAAGKGSRMNSDIPKVLHEINNKSLIMHVIDSAKKLSPKDQINSNTINSDNGNIYILTESITITSTPPLRTSISATSRACSPVSG